MKLILLTCLIVFSSGLDACWARLTSDSINGIDRICVYDHLGSTVTTVVRSGQFCDSLIMVDH
jgi:hypothetical protein